MPNETKLVKHQHYVPQFYLRQFASPAGKIWVYDKYEDKVFETAVRNVAGERYFYDSDEIAEITGDRQTVEKAFSKLESDFGPKIDRLLERLRTNAFTRLHLETRAVIAVFATLQFLRTKEQRIELAHITEGLRRFLKKHPDCNELLAECEEAMSEEKLQESHVRNMLNFPLVLEISELLVNHIWVIAQRHPSQSFYTSDVPLTKQGHVKIPYRGNNGIGSKGIEVHLPLAPDYAITMYERSHFADLTPYDGKVISLKSDQNMIYQRQHPVMYSTRYIFCQDNDFDFARQICNEEPHWRNPDRKRIVSNHDDDLSDYLRK